MVSARPALNHDKRDVAASQVQHRPAKGRHVAQLKAVDSENEISGLEPDLRGPGSRPHGSYREAPSCAGAKAKAQKAFGEGVDFTRGKGLGSDLHRARRLVAPKAYLHGLAFGEGSQHLVEVPRRLYRLAGELSHEVAPRDTRSRTGSARPHIRNEGARDALRNLHHLDHARVDVLHLETEGGGWSPRR